MQVTVVGKCATCGEERDFTLTLGKRLAIFEVLRLLVLQMDGKVSMPADIAMPLAEVMEALDKT